MKTLNLILCLISVPLLNAQFDLLNWDHQQHPKFEDQWIDSVRIEIEENDQMRYEKIYYEGSGLPREIIFSSGNKREIIDSVELSIFHIKGYETLHLDTHSCNDLMLVKNEKYDQYRTLYEADCKHDLELHLAIEFIKSFNDRMDYWSNQKGVKLKYRHYFLETDLYGKGERVYLITSSHDSIVYSYKGFSTQIDRIQSFQGGIEICETFEEQFDGTKFHLRNMIFRDSILQYRTKIVHQSADSLVFGTNISSWELWRHPDHCISQYGEVFGGYNSKILFYESGEIKEMTNVIWYGEIIPHMIFISRSQRRDAFVLYKQDGKEVKIQRFY